MIGLVRGFAFATGLALVMRGVMTEDSPKIFVGTLLMALGAQAVLA